VTFKDNFATSSEGAVYTINSRISFIGISVVAFTNNTAFYSGGALFTENHSTTLFSTNSTVPIMQY